MSKSLKLENDNYLDSQSVTHNRELLSVVLETIKNSISDMKETVLYDNETGSTGTITLNDNASNYRYLEIFYRTNDVDYDFTKVYEPNGKRVNLFAVRSNNATPRAYQKSRTVYINDTSISTYSEKTYAEFTNNNGSAGTLTITNNIWITRVVGYK